MKTTVTALFLFAIASLTACTSKKIQWEKGHVQQSLDSAKSQKKPVLLYWGATWCPPCNRLKAEVFPEKSVVTALNNYVAIYLDGDDPKAQKWADHFKTSGYPTLLILSSSGQELTRIPGEVETNQLVRILNRFQKIQKPVEELIQSAVKGDPLQSNEWEVVSHYDWYGDQRNLIEDGKEFEFFESLFKSSQNENDKIRSRFFFEYISHSKNKKIKNLPKMQEYLENILKNENLVALNSVPLSFSTKTILRSLKVSDSLFRLYESALIDLSRDQSSPAVQAYAMNGRIALHKHQYSKKPFPKVLKEDVKKLVNTIDQSIKHKTRRKSALSNSLWSLISVEEYGPALEVAQREAKKDPGYYGSMIGYIYIKQNKILDGLTWYKTSYESSKGAATKLQKGVGFITKLLLHAPDQLDVITLQTIQLVRETFTKGDGLSGRNKSQFEKLNRALSDWKKRSSKNYASLTRSIQKTCKEIEKVTTEDSGCSQWLKPI